MGGGGGCGGRLCISLGTSSVKMFQAQHQLRFDREGISCISKTVEICLYFDSTFEKDVLQVILMELFITVSFLVTSKCEMRQQ